MLNDIEPLRKSVVFVLHTVGFGNGISAMIAPFFVTDLNAAHPTADAIALAVAVVIGHLAMAFALVHTALRTKACLRTGPAMLITSLALSAASVVLGLAANNSYYTATGIVCAICVGVVWWGVE